MYGKLRQGSVSEIVKGYENEGFQRFDFKSKRGRTQYTTPLTVYFLTQMLSEITPTAPTTIIVDAPVQRMADVSGTAQLVALWLHGRSPKSQKSYERDTREFVVIKSDLYVELVKYRGNAGDNDAVFPSRKGGTPLSARQINQLVKDIAIASIKKDISPHWLRHAHATHALDRGTAPQLVQATLGHESLSTTGKYAHARPQQSSGLDLPG